MRFPYDVCGSDFVAPPPQPVNGVAFLSRYTLDRGVAPSGQTFSPEDLTAAYYRPVDPDDDGTTLLRFWDHNNNWVNGRWDYNVVYPRRFDGGGGRHIALETVAGNGKTAIRIARTNTMEDAITQARHNLDGLGYQTLVMTIQGAGSRSWPTRTACA